MRILSLETSTSIGSVATHEADTLRGETRLPRQQRSAQALAPSIVKRLSADGWTARQIELIATTRGPGSFTGLRIAVTTAKTLAYAIGAPVIALDTFEVIAAQAPGSDSPLDVVMDAQRQQLLTKRFRWDSSGTWSPCQAARIVDAGSWLSSLAPPLSVSGPGLAQISGHLPQPVYVVDRDLWYPRAKTVGKLAYQCYRAGRRDDIWSLVPEYHRKSAAEEKLAQREGTG